MKLCFTFLNRSPTILSIVHFMYQWHIPHFIPTSPPTNSPSTTSLYSNNLRINRIKCQPTPLPPKNSKQSRKRPLTPRPKLIVRPAITSLYIYTPLTCR